MTPGTVVAITDATPQTVGVVVRLVSATVAAVMIWVPSKGRWLRAEDFEIDRLQVAPDDWAAARNARESIRRNHGLIPYGGTFTRWARVWADGKAPAVG